MRQTSQEAEQKGSCEALRHQESGLGPRAQSVVVAVQEHQDHSTGPAKALLETGMASGAGSLGKALKPYFRGCEISTQGL